MNSDEIQSSIDYIVFCKERGLDCDCPDSEFKYIDHKEDKIDE